MQPIDLELLYNLGYAFTKQIRHITRINISYNYKIVINSPEVHFGIERSHAEVRNKTQNIFIYKNHLDRFCINRKQFIIKYLQHIFVPLLVHELAIT
jgi:hypothetical protein